MYKPRNVTKPPRQYNVYAAFLKARRSMNGPENFLGGSRLATQILLIVSVASRMKPTIRIVHLKLRVHDDVNRQSMGKKIESNEPYLLNEIANGNGKDGSAYA